MRIISSAAAIHDTLPTVRFPFSIAESGSVLRLCRFRFRLLTQNRIVAPTCSTRAGPAAVIDPNAAAPSCPFHKRVKIPHPVEAKIISAFEAEQIHRCPGSIFESVDDEFRRWAEEGRPTTEEIRNKANRAVNRKAIEFLFKTLIPHR